MLHRLGETTLELVQGDITREEVDAIVNAANPSLMGGGGVDGAIHRAGGTAILEECKRIRAERGTLGRGEAVITTGGKMSARHVIHTAGPVWRGGEQGEPEVLRRCYLSCLRLAAEQGLLSVSFPSISTGVYGYPVHDAAIVALEAVAEFMAGNPNVLKRVRFVLFDADTLEAYQGALADLPTIVTRA